MSVSFNQGQVLGRTDLDIFLTNASGNPANAYSISYAIYCVDPTSCVEVLIGSATRTPVNPAVGEYYAALQVPPEATVGDYRIRWTFQELATTPAQTVVQEFGVVGLSVPTTATTYSACVQGLITKLRFMLRDNCVGGEEIVELDVGGERIVVQMDDLYEALGELSPPPPGGVR